MHVNCINTKIDSLESVIYSVTIDEIFLKFLILFLESLKHNSIFRERKSICLSSPLFCLYSFLVIAS